MLLMPRSRVLCRAMNMKSARGGSRPGVAVALTSAAYRLIGFMSYDRFNLMARPLAAFC